MKIQLILSIAILITLSCSSPREHSREENYSTTNGNHNFKTISDLTSEQVTALEALNTLQVSTDERNRLYSTFAGIDQPCYPPNSSLTISQANFLEAMSQKL
jgi:hypothetical protein